MKTTIDKVFHVDEPIAKVWANLSNPQEVATCVPGAQLTEVIDDRNFKGEVTMRFGPVKASYDGEITITELNEGDHVLVMQGKGLDSKGKGSADMTMRGSLNESDGGTEVKFTMEVSVVGMLAQFGSRLINDVTNQVLDKFVDNFKAKLAGEEVENELQAGSMVGSIVKNKIGGIFGGQKDS